jgi:hypothetical protein
MAAALCPRRTCGPSCAVLGSLRVSTDDGDLVPVLLGRREKRY